MKRLSLLLTAALLAAATFAQAEPTPESRRLEQISPKAERYTVKKPGSNVDAGAARIIIKAPLSEAQTTVTDFKNYSKMISKFEESRVVGRHGDKTDVYLRVPVLKGAAKVWAIMRFEPPKKVSDDETVMTASMVQGNVKKFEAKYRLKRIDDRKTQLDLEMLLVPQIPAPGSAVTREVADASDQAVRRFRDHTEKRTAK